MAIILKLDRPLISLLKEQPFGDALPAQFRNLPKLEAKIRKLAQAVGRLNLEDGPVPYIGTVLAVGERSVIAAKHSIESLFDRADRKGSGLATFSPKYRPYLSFSVDGTSGTRIEIEDLLFVHPVLDVAALRTKAALPASTSRLMARRPKSMVGRVIAAIGYPTGDARNPLDPNLMEHILQGPESTLHVSVGLVNSVQAKEMSIVQLFHDCTTLGGFSGGPLLDVISGDVIGIHLGGMFLHHNFATPSWEIGRDPRVRVHPITFTAPASPWDHLWEPLLVAPPAVPLRDGMLTVGPKVQIWEDDTLLWEKEVDANPFKALTDLFLDLFANTHEIRTFAGPLKYDLPENLAPREMADRLVELLQSRREINDAFFQRLKKEHPQSHQFIRATQFRWEDLLEQAVGAACRVK